ncbi:MAG: radical SAM family heme chaperone HemW [Fibrobacterota bacterium]
MKHLFSTARDLSLYIHIPFCRSRCIYCDFPTGTRLSSMDAFIRALCAEIRTRLAKTPALQERSIRTIYIGGGTPSLLKPTHWEQIFRQLKEFRLSPDLEWTVEGNPDSARPETLALLAEHGVTRLSFGVQSLDDTILEKLNRPHRRDTVHKLLADPVLKQFDSITCDLMYGLPHQTPEMLSNDIRQITAFDVVQHISLYELTLAEDTPLWKSPLRQHLCNEAECRNLADTARRLLADRGYRRYEVSNYAQQGFESRHNMRYWQCAPYLGFGPGAHSFDGEQRFENHTNLDAYCATSAGTLPPGRSEPPADTQQRREEFLFLHLRTAAGIDPAEYRTFVGESFMSELRQSRLTDLVKEGLITETNGVWHPTDAGLDRADGMTLHLLL